MPRRAGFRYQIDRRRSRKEQEKDEQEDAFINEEGEDEEEEDSPFEAEAGGDKRAKTSDLSEEDDDDDDGGDDSSHENVRAPRRGARSRRSHAVTTAKRKTQDDDDHVDGSEGGEEDSSNTDNGEEESDYEDKPAASKAFRTRNSTKGSKTTTKGLRRKSSPSASKKRKIARHDENDGDSEDEAERSEELDSSSEEDQNPDGESDEAYVPGRMARRSRRKASNLAPVKPPKKVPSRGRGRVAAKTNAGDTDDGDSEEEYIQEDGEEEEEEEEDDDDEDEDQEKESATARKNLRPAGRTRASSDRSVRGRPAAPLGDAHDSLADLPSPRRSSAMRATRKLSRLSKIEEMGSDQDLPDDENYEGAHDSLASLSSPRRSSAMKAKLKLKRISAVEELSSDQDLDPNEAQGSEESDFVEKRTHPESRPKSVTKTKKRKAVASSDEEFLADSESDHSGDDSLSDEEVDTSDEKNDLDDEAMVGDPELSDSDVDDGTQAVDIDNEQVGTADDDDDSSDGDGRESPTGKQMAGKKKEILPSPHKGIFENSDADTDDFDEDSGKSESIQKTERVKLPYCSSVEDAITHETLPKRHVCYIAPDGKSRQCFRLETLRQIALNSSQLQLRVDLDRERQNFLQPPHFRAAMSDELVDQIASRFGREALDLHGPFYNSKLSGRGAMTRSSNEYVAETDESDDDDVYAFDTFRDRIKGYLKRMGSQDVYVCPLCYGRSHRNLVDPDGEKDEENVPTESKYDPMEVLGHLDNDEFEIASQFCFTKVAEVRRHLREDHNVDTRGIQGNDLYMRFRIRAPDGLLQRWIAHTQGNVKQGYMLMYWNEGNNQNYIHLLDLMKRARFYSETLTDNLASEELKSAAEDYTSKAQSFFDTFSENAQAQWRVIAAPFHKVEESMEDFIKADEDIEEGEDDAKPHALLYRELEAAKEESDPNDLAHKIQRKYADLSDDDEGIVSDAESASSEDDELELIDNGESEMENLDGYYSPIDEETDEWMKSKLNQRKRKSPRASERKRKPIDTDLETPMVKKLTRRKSTPPTTTAVATPSTGTSVARRAPAIMESDDED